MPALVRKNVPILYHFDPSSNLQLQQNEICSLYRISNLITALLQYKKTLYLINTFNSALFFLHMLFTLPVP